ASRRRRGTPGSRRRDRPHPQQQRHGRARGDDLWEGSRVTGSDTVAVLGPGRIGRQIALTFALGGCRVLLVDLKNRSVAASELFLAAARREIARDLMLMAEERVIAEADVASALDRIEERVGLGDLGACAFVQEALPESVELKCAAFKRLSEVISADSV